MPKGTLELSGTIDLDQFWPTTKSDGDTVKVLVSGPNAFTFRPHPGLPAKVTHAFEGAKVLGKASDDAIKNGFVTIRLQAIDAPELHYTPVAPTINKVKPTPAQRAAFKAANGEFRQKLGETASVALHDFLARVGPSPIACKVRTMVDEPNEVFDTFGRMIGNIIVTLGGVETDANMWMAENGWAFPTFYSSMTPEEINQTIALTEKARKAKAGIWKSASSDMGPFDNTLKFRNHGVPDPATDKGPVILPKLFRRRSTYGVAVAAGMFNGNFKSYLKTEPDFCFKTSEFLADGLNVAAPHQLDEFITPGGQFTVAAKDLVFKENASKVVGADGKPVHW